MLYLRLMSLVARTERERILPPLRPIERRIKTNFYWAYHHAQFDPMLQTALQLYTTQQYPTEEKGSLAEINTNLSPHIDGLRVPRKHTKVIEDIDGKPTELTPTVALTAETGFQMEWKNQMRIFHRVFNNTPTLDDIQQAEFSKEQLFDLTLYHWDRLSHENLLAKILVDMTKQDAYYVTVGRPNRGTQEETYESFFRGYAFEGKDAQSPDFVNLYGELRGFLNQLGLTSQPLPSSDDIERKGVSIGLNSKSIQEITISFTNLVQTWEERHKQHFFPTQ